MMTEIYYDTADYEEDKYIPPTTSASPPPAWFATYEDNTPIKICSICDAPSNGFHFNAPSCSACAAFFRRTVTLDRKFACAHVNNCRVNFSMRVICRACRYSKCVANGMERKAVQPRRDCNVGRRKINYSAFKGYALKPNQQQPPQQTNGLQIPCSAPSNIITNAMTRTEIIEDPTVQLLQQPQEATYATSYASSTGATDLSDPAMSPMPSSAFSMNHGAVDILDELLREERKYNDRRRVLFASSHTVTAMIAHESHNDIPFTDGDLFELTFHGIQKDSRSMILLVHEWIKALPGYNQMSSLYDKKAFLCRALLYQCILDPAYVTVQLGLPDRFIMFNGGFVGIAEGSEIGWGDERGFIKGDMKKSLYRPLLARVMKQIVQPLADLNLSFTEFVAFKALVSWKSTCVAEFSTTAKEYMQVQIDALFTSLHNHYRSIGYDEEKIAERTGAVVLLMCSIVDVGLEILESHQKIQLFDLWELDSLLLQLLSRGFNPHVRGSRKLSQQNR
ncbi:hypothetical protein PENTCL1PPCAC_11015 [Pristionchus entomophagus]|uniref:Uncharacterized protein n=1 Tax=Pristionchus entomophagus TaxID=358040 RepID=A0AAV5T1B1_9BILA|nr:hypothetical protein PENTCL1PPCAC_11015 [Pristionchus entomophagus]